MKKNFDYSISLCRVTAMIMIIVCHFGTALGKSAIGEAFQVGVQIFLFISGYLYGNIQIKDYFHWIRERFMRIYIPFIIFIFYSICLNIAIGKEINILMMVLSFFNLQGYHHIFNNWLYYNPIEGTAHLWYLTILALCYLLTIVIKKIEEHRKLTRNEIAISLTVLLILSCALGLKGIRIDYLFIYFCGYFYSRRKDENKIDYYVSVGCLVIACLLRYSMKKYCDVYGDNFLYLYVVIPLSYNLLSFWIFKFVKLITKYMNTFFENNTCRKLLLYVDGLSFYVYLTHYQFIDGPISFLYFTDNLYINICTILGLIVISSIILKYCTERTIQMLKRER